MPRLCSSNPSGAGCFRLLDLPAEIRLLIYEHVFPPPAPIDIIPFGAGLDSEAAIWPECVLQYEKLNPRGGLPSSIRPQNGLLLTCSQIHRECRELAFQRSVFHINWAFSPTSVYTQVRIAEHVRLSNITTALNYITSTGAYRLITYISICQEVHKPLYRSQKQPSSFSGVMENESQLMFANGELPNVRHLTLAHVHAHDYGLLSSLEYLPRLRSMAIVYMKRKRQWMRRANLASKLSHLHYEIEEFFAPSSRGDHRDSPRPRWKPAHIAGEHCRTWRRAGLWCFGISTKRFGESISPQLREEFGDIKHVHVRYGSGNDLRSRVKIPQENSCPLEFYDYRQGDNYDVWGQPRNN